MTDQDVQKNYDEFWKEIVENSDGTLNKEQIMKELSDFSVLISNLSKLYCYISGNRASYPNINADSVLGLFEEQLEDSYARGYDDAIEDCVGAESVDE